MPDDKELVVQKARELVTRSSVDNPIGIMLQGIVEKGVTAENAAVLEKVCDLYEKMDAIGARKSFAAAKCLLQAELPTVMATSIIPTTTGEVRSRFAPYEEIMGKVGPYLVKHGFSVSFTMKAEGGRMEAICTLTHSGGHSESNSFSVRVGSGPPKCSEAQSDGAARSYARRGALCDALNIVIDKDTDAHLEGACISADAARDLAARAKEAGIDEKSFLRLAGAEGFATIREHKLPILEQVLREKRAAPTPAAESPAAPAAPDPLVAARIKISELCDSLAGRWKVGGQPADNKAVLRRATKKVLGDALALGELNFTQTVLVREFLESQSQEGAAK